MILTLPNCNTPPNPKWFFRVIVGLTILSWMLLLSGCSTPRAAAWSPPQAAMMKSVPLPDLPIDKAAPDNAPSTIGLAELAEDNLTITSMYRALARRHDALVDAVVKHLEDHAK